MWAVANYGFNANKYVRMTIDRINKIYNKHLNK